MTDAELIKSKIDIVNFISDYITLKKAGRNYKSVCPFHSEKTPSFVVSPERGSWHCFGACGEGGDAISFLQKWENIEFLEALKILAKKVGVKLTGFTPTDNIREKEKLYEINHLACEFFHFLLTKHALGERGREYLEKRRIKKETINTFMLGYAPNSWDSLSKYLQKKGYSPEDICLSGLTIKSDSGRYYDRFRGRLMFTLKDHRGNMIGFSGRLLNEEVYPERERGAKYINSPETPIYHKGSTLYGMDVTREYIKKKGEAVIVEGEFDFLSSFQSGVGNVVAIKGSALTEDQVLLLKRYTENLIMALDSDFAGNEAARRGIEVADNTGLTVKVVRLLYGKDPAECAEKSPHLWKDSVAKAVPIYDFVIDTALSKYDKSTADGKKKIGDEVLPLIAKIQNPIIASHYVKKLTRELEVNEESIEMLIRRIGKNEGKKPPLGIPLTVHNRVEMIEEYLLSLIIQSKFPKKSLEKVMTITAIDDYNLPAVSKIISLLSGYFIKHEDFDVKNFGSLLNAEIASTFDKAYLIELESVLSDDKKFDKELIQVAKTLKQNALRRKINNISTKIRSLDEKGDSKEISSLNSQLKTHFNSLKELDKVG